MDNVEEFIEETENDLFVQEIIIEGMWKYYFDFISCVCLSLTTSQGQGRRREIL